MPTFNLPSYGMSSEKTLQPHYSVIHFANVSTTQGILCFLYDGMLYPATNMQVRHDVTAAGYLTSCVKDKEELERKVKIDFFPHIFTAGQSLHDEGLNVRLSVSES